MLFSEALELLRQGKNVARESWSQADGYLVFMKGMKHIWKIITHPTPNAGNHILSVEELLASDWAEYDENKFAVKEANEELDAA